MEKKKIVIVAIALITLIGVAYASYWVYSNIAHVTVSETSYTLTLSAYPTEIVLGERIEFYGTLKLGNTGVEDALIHIYMTNATGDILDEIGVTTTVWFGEFDFTWTPTETGDYYFKAGYEITD